MLDFYDDIFSAEGPCRELPGYAPRAGQIVMARMIGDALATKNHALVEAPPGTGKSLAYGVAVARRIESERAAGRGTTVVISTESIALQEQLFFKDLPFLTGQLFPNAPLRVAMLKGKANYLCLRELDGFGTKLDLTPGERHVLEWARKTNTGDKNEAGVPDQVWREFVVDSDDCAGSLCQHFKECWHERAKMQARTANIIVTNHTLLCIHLMVFQQAHEHVILPKFNAVVVDEAHRLPAVARGVWGAKVTAKSIARATAPWRKIINYESASGSEWAERGKALLTSIDEVVTGLFGQLDQLVGKTADHNLSPQAVAQAIDPVGQALWWLGDHMAVRFPPIDKTKEPEPVGDGVFLPPDVSDIHEGRADYDEGRGRVEGLIERLASFAANTDDLAVWCEDNALHRQPLAIGAILRNALLDRVPSGVFVSATLATRHGDDPMNHMKHELGFYAAGVIEMDRVEYIAASPFDLASQLRLFVPPLPLPTAETFLPAATQAIYDVIVAAGGRTLALFTSKRVLDAAYAALARRLPYRVLKQYDAPVQRLVEEFKRDTRSCLFGTKSMWSGIDVPGEALSCLVIDRIPFAGPYDPIQATLERKRGGRWNAGIRVPPAVIEFRQGWGRLIRRTTDRGVVVVLDNRILVSNYSADFLASLAGVPRLQTPQEIGEFLDAGEQKAASPVPSRHLRLVGR